ncbi:hypothetical protein PCK2_000677 [Pneumocystis canis]|nr:hypothetical protein PCK2_000677 [Pneumocystis canis]
MYTGKAAIRTVKNLKYSDVQNKVRSATSNDPWGPSGVEMSEIARMTFDPHNFVEVMDMLDRRMNDKGKNWRHVFKALTVLDYCLHSGSENTVKWAKDNIYIIKTLREFNYISDDGKDQGSNGIGNHLQSQLYYTLEYLKKWEEPKTSKEISSYLSIPLSAEFIDRLRTNERIEYDPYKDTYYFKPIYNIRSAASLVAFLTSSVTAVGILVIDLKEGWSSAIDEIERLEKDGQVLVLRAKKDGFAKSVWPNHSEGQESVDEEFKTIWHSLTIPSPSDLPRELEKVGLKPTSIDPATIKKIPVMTNLQKHKKRRSHRGRITNTHLNSLKDYSDRRL